MERNIIYPNVYVARYINYSSKYGLGYLLSNDTVGVYYNDHSKIFQSKSDFNYATYIHKATETQEPFSEKIQLENFPENLKKKVTLYKNFKKYFDSRKTRAKIPKSFREMNEDFLNKQDAEIKILQTSEEVEENPQIRVSKFMNKINEH